MLAEDILYRSRMSDRIDLHIPWFDADETTKRALAQDRQAKREEAMNKRINISSGSSFEKAYGYSRAVKVGETVYVAGTVGYDYAAGTCSEDPVEQLRQIVRNMQPALATAGARLEDVVQITTYVTSADVFEAIGPTLNEIFGEIRPTNTALVVQFPFPQVKLEISAIAVIGCA